MSTDPDSRVAVETLVTTGLVTIAGEVTTDAYSEIPGIVRQRIIEIGYDSSTKGFDGRSCGVQVAIGQQSQGHRAGRGSRVRGAHAARRTTRWTPRAPATRA